MINYNEEILTGEIKAWTRAYEIIVKNPYGGVPTVMYNEERKAEFPDGSVIGMPLDVKKKIEEEFTDPNKVINLINPETGDSLGTTTYQYVQVILCSLYHQLAAERDAYEPYVPPVE